jgi:riboflavin synthase
MFTGLVTDIGTIRRTATTDAGREFLVESSYDEVENGESIAVDGVCLTVREWSGAAFVVSAAAPTLSRTTLGDWEVGRRVNLERALRAGDRLGGHFVQGHVDAVGTVRSVERRGDALHIDVGVPPELEPLLVLHGSVAVNGVSLTVNALSPGQFQVMLIDYTLRHSNLGALDVAARVNVEADIIGKYVQRRSELGA